MKHAAFVQGVLGMRDVFLWWAQQKQKWRKPKRSKNTFPFGDHFLIFLAN